MYSYSWNLNSETEWLSTDDSVGFPLFKSFSVYPILFCSHLIQEPLSGLLLNISLINFPVM